MSSQIEVTITPEKAENTEKYWSDDDDDDTDSILLVDTPTQLINRFLSLVEQYMRTSDKHIKRLYNLIKWSKICKQ